MARVVEGKPEAEAFEGWMVKYGHWGNFKVMYGLQRGSHLDSYLDENHASHYISGAFNWREAGEGDFWARVSDEWNMYLTTVVKL